MFPLHLWLPDAYANAPSVVSALLAATATKVAVYVMLRLPSPVFGAAFSFESMPLASLLLLLGAAGVFAASTGGDLSGRRQAHAGLVEHRPGRLHGARDRPGERATGSPPRSCTCSTTR